MKSERVLELIALTAISIAGWIYTAGTASQKLNDVVDRVTRIENKVDLLMEDRRK